MTYIVEIVSIIAGIAYMLTGILRYGIWKGISIGGGFMPLLCGGLVTLFSVLMLISKIKKGEKAEKFDKKALIPVGAMIAILLCNYLVSLLGACIVVAFLWLKFIEKYSVRKSLLVSVIMFAAVYGIFRLWLNVPFPEGLLGELL
ncbi:Tripartite tricarboxylate transporter TctB family protein [Oscillibacter sp. PC13]|uniref:tripartite tricarboxylate transporter TctB family protein n=1 Tax=Oscillibacter sp. PC13 TaxID=1855299 RepID=UPI0008E0B3D4|nr:tripartite tricarboxylate transporter TctB family protein [Oscillibacter sp. PC13]SFP70053.1 Tripartite tricarboxylate transporter TctB family protein [Oscillibacter sp. PC13]